MTKSTRQRKTLLGIAESQRKVLPGMEVADDFLKRVDESIKHEEEVELAKAKHGNNEPWWKLTTREIVGGIVVGVVVLVISRVLFS